uniref:RNA helicase n=1 Tax=Eptatretus burgeri TaxID=7764 RepID=A0A8C4QM37_EPTBU
MTRRALHVRVKGHDAPDPVLSFETLGETFNLSEQLLKNVASLGFKRPSPVQAQSLPAMLKGLEVLVAAPTGTGKTLAFGLPIVHHLAKDKKKYKRLRAVLLAPTRELASQSGELRPEGEAGQVDTNTKRAGGGKKEKGRKRFAENVTNTVAENKDEQSGDGLPRVEDETQSVWKNRKQNECGKERRNERQRASFAEQLSVVMAACTKMGVQPQKALFSATLTAKVDNWVKENLTNPIRIIVGTKNTPSLRVHQELLFVGGEDGKRVAMRQLLTQNMTPPILIFVQSVERAKQLAHELEFDGLRVGQLHGQQTHTQRRDSLLAFRSGNIWLLICTDLAARGLDLPATRLVINYDLPTTTAAYVHRVGRTGRAGNSGKAVTFFTEDDRPLLRRLLFHLYLSKFSIENTDGAFKNKIFVFKTLDHLQT